MPSKREITDIAGFVKHETDRAFLFNDGTKDVWLPKSQCEWDEDSQTMTLPIWLAQEKELI